MRISFLMILGSALAAGCAKQPEQRKDSMPMAAMPGMAISPDSGKAPAGDEKSGDATPRTLSLTASQIAHGKIAWSGAAPGTTSVTASIPGQITTDEDHTVRLGAQTRGRVLSVTVNPGDRVSRGQALVVLQSPDAGMSQSDLSKAQAALSSQHAQAAYAKAARERAERLLTLKAIPRQDYERAIADDELAQSQVRQAEAELRRAQTVAQQFGADSSGNGNVVLRSPQDGVVLSRTAVPGAVIDVGAPLVVVTDPSHLWLVVNAPEQFAGLFRAGGELRFVVPAYPDTFAARVTSLGAGLDPDTRTLPVRGAVNSRGERLKPGMLATVAVAGARSAAAVLVPENAVQSIDGKENVFVVTPDGKGGASVTRREVDVGPRAEGRVAITRGLTAGELVVTAGAFAVKSAFKKGAMPMEM